MAGSYEGVHEKIARGFSAGAVLIGERAFKFVGGERLVSASGRMAVVEKSPTPVKGWINYRIFIDDARLRRHCYQAAFSPRQQRMANCRGWVSLLENNREVAEWAEAEIRKDTGRKYGE